MIDPEKVQRLRDLSRMWWQELRPALVFVALMIAFRSAVADWSDVPTGSMKPTIIEGDRIFVNKLAYDLRLPLTHISLWRLADPQRGDIIVFDSEVSGLRLVKRVIGLPGDVVEVIGDVVHVNGQPLQYLPIENGADALVVDVIEEFGALTGDQETVSEDTRHTVRVMRGGLLSNFAAATVPPDSYFVLGDNRDNSADSRVIGFVPRSEIVGRSSSVVLSLDYEHSYMPRPERFFHPL